MAKEFHETTMLIPRSLITNTKVIASIDQGGTLTKLVYRTEHDKDHLIFHFVECGNDEFDGLLHWMTKKLKCFYKIDRNAQFIRLTGVGGDKHKSKIEQVSGLRAEFISEFESQAKGAHFLVSNFEDDVFCYKKIDATLVKQHDVPNWVKESRKKYDDTQMCKKYPCLFVFAGSGFGVNKLTEDGKIDMISASMFCGKTFMGQARMLLGTNDYDHIMEMASRGSYQLDTKARDVMNVEEGAEYNIMPPDASIFAFGNVQQNYENLKKEDIATSLLISFVKILQPLIELSAKCIDTRKIYIGGNFFKSEVARRTMTNHNYSITSAPDEFEVRYINNGHTGAIGAFTTD